MHGGHAQTRRLFHIYPEDDLSPQEIVAQRARRAQARQLHLSTQASVASGVQQLYPLALLPRYRRAPDSRSVISLHKAWCTVVHCCRHTTHAAPMQLRPQSTTAPENVATGTVCKEGAQPAGLLPGRAAARHIEGKQREGAATSHAPSRCRLTQAVIRPVWPFGPFLFCRATVLGS